jgi:hypothetical protein
VYAIASNHRLLGWLRHYVRRHHRRPPTRAVFVRDFGRAVVEHGASHVVLALIRSSLEKQSAFVFSDAMLDVIFHGTGIDDDPGTGGGEGTGPGTGPGTDGTDPGTDPGTGTDPATEMSTGTGGTEQSTGTGGTGDTEQSTGTGDTEQSTGTGDTEQSTGTGDTDSGSGFLGFGFAQVTIEALVRYAIQLRAAGALDVVFEG